MFPLFLCFCVAGSWAMGQEWDIRRTGRRKAILQPDKIVNSHHIHLVDRWWLRINGWPACWSMQGSGNDVLCSTYRERQQPCLQVLLNGIRSLKEHLLFLRPLMRRFFHCGDYRSNKCHSKIEQWKEKNLSFIGEV